MKKYITTSFSVFLLLMLLTFATPVSAQDPPPPPGHGESGNIPGGGAPIGEGLIMLVALGAAYGYKKWKTREE